MVQEQRTFNISVGSQSAHDNSWDDEFVPETLNKMFGVRNVHHCAETKGILQVSTLRHKLLLPPNFKVKTCNQAFELGLFFEC